MQNTYIRYEGAGDQYVGRTAAGIPADDYRFCTLPPHLVQISVDVERCVILMFPNYPQNMFYVLEHCVASLIFHTGFLRDILSEDHPLFCTPLFVTPGLYSNLCESVVCGVPSATGLQATGIPPHTKTLKQISDMEAALKQL